VDFVTFLQSSEIVTTENDPERKPIAGGTCSRSCGRLLEDGNITVFRAVDSINQLSRGGQVGRGDELLKAGGAISMKRYCVCTN
jgi:hypothetical protein